ncbi:MAG: DUF86 domain-containing protein [Chloroflexi bacterium]|nr:DUF86 domain-containing protein [Chloroflexota bacterium]
MNRRDDSHRVIDMLRYAELAIAVLDGDSLEQLSQDVVKSAALSKFVENVGEAAYKSDPGTLARYPQVDWPRMIGMRHRLVHEYYNIRLDILHDVIVNYLPPLIEDLGGSGRLS